jgi:hypothetical protein
MLHQGDKKKTCCPQALFWSKELNPTAHKLVTLSLFGWPNNSSSSKDSHVTLQVHL